MNAMPTRGPRRAGLFEEDFDLPPAPGVPEPEIIAPGPESAALAAARADAWAEGYAAGRAEAEAEAGQAAGAAAAALAREMAELREALLARAEAAAEATAQLLMDALAACFPALCARHGAAEACAVARAVLPGLLLEPEIVLRAPPALVPAMEREVARAMAEEDRARLRIVPDPALPPGDLRLRWRGGMATRDSAALWDAAVAALAPNGLLGAPLKETCDAE